MSISADQLPDDPDALKNARLVQIIKELQRDLAL